MNNDRNWLWKWGVSRLTSITNTDSASRLYLQRSAIDHLTNVHVYQQKNSWRDWPCRYASANWSTTLFNSLIVLESDVAGFLNARFLNTHGTCADCRCRRKIKKIKDDLSDLCSPNCLHLRIHKSSFLRNRMSDSENLKCFLFRLNPSFKYYTF